VRGAALLSAAVLLTPACERRTEPPAPEEEEGLRRAAYRAFAAEAALSACADPGDAGRYQQVRFAELRRLAEEKKMGRAFWRAGNDWAAASARTAPTCPPDAAAILSRRLDALAAEMIR
jgi:hypothetical protein